jgi:hypothetical protein
MALMRFLYTLLLTHLAILIVGAFAVVGAAVNVICLWGGCPVSGEVVNPVQSLAKASLFRIEGTRHLSLDRDIYRCIRCRIPDE